MSNPMTAEERRTWLEERRKGIGSSDMAIIAGLRGSIPDLYLEKTGQVPVEDGAASEPAEIGLMVEPVLLDWAEAQLGELERHPVRSLELKDGDGLVVPIRANIDAIVIATGACVEAKTRGMANPEWGGEGTDEIPEPYIVQGTTEMVCAETELCHFPTLMGGLGGMRRIMYRVEWLEGLWPLLAEKACKFWWHVVNRVPPDGTPTLAVLKRLRREPNKTIPLTGNVAEALDLREKFKAIAKDADAQAEEQQATIIAALGDAEGGTLPDGRTLTYMEETRRIQAKAAYEQRFRTLRVKRARRG